MSSYKLEGKSRTLPNMSKASLNHIHMFQHMHHTEQTRASTVSADSPAGKKSADNDSARS